MSIKNAYLNEVYQGLAKRNAEQKEFLQAVEEVLESLEPVVAAHPEYEKAGLIERLVEPERVIRLCWIGIEHSPTMKSGVLSRQSMVRFTAPSVEFSIGTIP